MNYVFGFDVETSGLYDKHLPLIHLRQPHIVQIACVLANEKTGDEIAVFSSLVNPDGLEQIDAAAQAAHGLTLDAIRAAGVPLATALSVWSNLRGRADVEVGHNIAFDEQMIAVAAARLKRQITTRTPAKRVCTMELCAPLMRLPATERMKATIYAGKPKAPSLAEAHQFFFGEEFAGVHDALADVRASLRLYFQLRDDLRTAHDFHTSRDHVSQHETDRCQVCSGHLALCKTCGGAEASLPIDCPGRPMYHEQSDQVQTGYVDFIRGRWYERPWMKKEPDSAAG